MLLTESDRQTNISGYNDRIEDTTDEPAVEPPFPEISGDQVPVRIEARKSGVVVIDHFPFGSPGASIDSPSEDATVNGPNCRAPGDSIWAPFRSQCDWEIAHWAKMRGPTSSAVTELLAISDVCVPRFHLSWC